MDEADRRYRVNAVPAVITAPAGFVTMADLPLIRSHTGFGNG